MQKKPIVRMTASGRREWILNAAMGLADSLGFSNFSSVELGRVLGCGHSIIFHYFPSMDALREAVMEQAIAQENVKILLEGLVCQNPTAIAAPEELKQKARLNL